MSSAALDHRYDAGVPPVDVLRAARFAASHAADLLATLGEHVELMGSVWAMPAADGPLGRLAELGVLGPDVSAAIRHTLSAPSSEQAERMAEALYAERLASMPCVTAATDGLMDMPGRYGRALSLWARCPGSGVRLAMVVPYVIREGRAVLDRPAFVTDLDGVDASVEVLPTFMEALSEAMGRVAARPQRAAVHGLYAALVHAQLVAPGAGVVPLEEAAASFRHPVLRRLFDAVEHMRPREREAVVQARRSHVRALGPLLRVESKALEELVAWLRVHGSHTGTAPVINLLGGQPEWHMLGMALGVVSARVLAPATSAVALLVLVLWPAGVLPVAASGLGMALLVDGWRYRDQTPVGRFLQASVTGGLASLAAALVVGAAAWAFGLGPLGVPVLLGLWGATAVAAATSAVGFAAEPPAS